ncbi:MAG: glucose-6-phosphate dehydrogenase [Corynebacterium humireducens]|jgi:glucose-6-phosphate 1-dehydrogenase|uniref:Glucose-6-phosphate dehydrogenase n=1 Tax=Corynebacterium humireducens TaxID=1223514 RepID=A0A7X6PM31_9CORY|nr:glucose-6-phosphate dehydrogenase [Corynebacterium humireducens]
MESDSGAHTIVILGGAGDLARRLLIPGLGEYAESARIIGVGRTSVDYPALVAESGAEHLAEGAEFLAADATDPADLRRVLDATGEGAVLYFALAPEVTVKVVTALADVDLPADLLLAVEKPYGRSAEEADELDRRLLALTDEEHIFRVDHFLCEAALTNLSGLIRANLPLGATWSGEYVEAIDIIYEESLALEGRAEFYDSTGALRDMVQSHLLQVMAHLLCADGRAEPAAVLDATSVIEGSVRRARYDTYAAEEGVDPSRGTETLVQLDLTVDLPRWQGTRVRLRSGKAIGDPEQAVTVHYRAAEGLAPARLVLPFADDMLLELNVPDPGDVEDLRRVTLHSDTVPSRLSPYGRVMRALLTGDHSVAVPVGTPQRAWEILRPVLEGFASGEIPLEEYPAGSAGPWE